MKHSFIYAFDEQKSQFPTPGHGLEPEIANVEKFVRIQSARECNTKYHNVVCE